MGGDCKFAERQYTPLIIARFSAIAPREGTASYELGIYVSGGWREPARSCVYPCGSV